MCRAMRVENEMRGIARPRRQLQRLPGRQCQRQGARGFTLIEILVAIACLVVLSTVMAVVLTTSVRLWRRARARRVVYDRAQTLFALLAEDVKPVFIWEQPAGPDTPDNEKVQVHLLCNADENGNQVLSFVRSVSEIERATGMEDNGLVRVTYSQVPRGDGLVALRRAMSPSLSEPEGTDAMITDDLLYFGARFWLPTTRRWDIAVTDQNRHGPTDVWDSTCGAFPSFAYYASEESLDDATDDVFPEMARFIVVIEARGETAVLARLLTPLTAVTTGRVGLTTTRGFPRDAVEIPYLPSQAEDTGYVEQQESSQYVKIGDEWIRYTEFDDTSIVIAPDGRGARGTTAALHRGGATVHVGKQFVATFRLPSYRENTDISPADCGTEEE